VGVKSEYADAPKEAVNWQRGKMKPNAHRVYEVKPQKASRRRFQEYSEAFVVAIILATLLRAILVQAFEIPSGSMEPTLRVGDHILVNKLIYGVRIPFTDKRWPIFREPSRGDVIVFVYPVDRSKDFIKRVIAVGGDTLEIRDRKVLINGRVTADPHAYFSSDVVYPGDAGPRDNMKPIEVPKGFLFVMGDNRDNSYDSRFWGFVSLRDVVGDAFIIYYSSRGILDVHWNRFFKLIH
jgi:signal peptidase I